MRLQDIKIGEFYRLKEHPNYCYAQAVGFLKPMEHPNENKFTVVKCLYSVQKNDNFTLVKYFKPNDLQKGKPQ